MRERVISVAAAVITFLLARALLSGGGTLDDPTGDGAISAVVREWSGDGPFMGIFAVVALVIAYGVPLLILRRGFRKKGPAAEADSRA